MLDTQRAELFRKIISFIQDAGHRQSILDDIWLSDPGNMSRVVNAIHGYIESNQIIFTREDRDSILAHLDDAETAISDFINSANRELQRYPLQGDSANILSYRNINELVRHLNNVVQDNSMSLNNFFTASGGIWSSVNDTAIPLFIQEHRHENQDNTIKAISKGESSSETTNNAPSTLPNSISKFFTQDSNTYIKYAITLIVLAFIVYVWTGDIRRINGSVGRINRSLEEANNCIQIHPWITPGPIGNLSQISKDLRAIRALKRLFLALAPAETPRLQHR